MYIYKQEEGEDSEVYLTKTEERESKRGIEFRNPLNLCYEKVFKSCRF